VLRGGIGRCVYKCCNIFCNVLSQATRKAGHPRKLFDDIVAAAAVTMVTRPSAKKPNAAQDQWYEEERLNSASVAQVIARIYGTSAHFVHLGVDNDLCVELAQAIVRFNAWSDVEDYITVAELRTTVCCLCSFRSLQKRLQVRLLISLYSCLCNADRRSIRQPFFIRALV
jgi:hypothetical protein